MIVEQDVDPVVLPLDCVAGVPDFGYGSDCFQIVNVPVRSLTVVSMVRGSCLDSARPEGTSAINIIACFSAQQAKFAGSQVEWSPDFQYQGIAAGLGFHFFGLL